MDAHEHQSHGATAGEAYAGIDEFLEAYEEGATTAIASALAFVKGSTCEAEVEVGVSADAAEDTDTVPVPSPEVSAPSPPVPVAAP